MSVNIDLILGSECKTKTSPEFSSGEAKLTLCTIFIVTYVVYAWRWFVAATYFPGEDCCKQCV